VMLPLFFIAENYLTGDDFAQQLKPLVGLLFNVKDRGVRGMLLQKMTVLAENLDANTLNVKVFEPMCSGFSDSSAALRELTLKSTLTLVPHLTAPNLEKLTRYLVRLQSDTEVSIRTNTIIFISKLPSYLTPISREKLILPAFVRAMKDNFAPCRLAALQCLTGVQEFFGPEGLASKLLPSITPHLLDADSNVRKEAFSVTQALLLTLKTESDKRTAKEDAQRAQQQAQQQRQSQQSSASNGSAGATIAAPADTTSYLAGFASWVSSASQPTTETQPMQPQLPPTNTLPPQQRPPPAPNSAPLQLPSQSQIPAVQQQMSGMTMKTIPNQDDGWDDVDDDDGGGGGGWGDDDLDVSHSAGAAEDDPFASIGMRTRAPKPAGKLAVGGAKGKLILPSKKSPAVAAPVAVKKLAVDDDNDIADGWDDF
jgi:SCY1-like protein 1